MEEKTRQNLEDTMNDLLDRAYACEADSEDYLKYIKQASQIADVLNDEKKIEASCEVTKKDMFVVGAPIAAGGIGMLFRAWVLKRQTHDICEFEINNSFTSSAGRWLSQSFRELFSFNRRGH